MEHRYAVHPADFFFFGLTEDLRVLFTRDLISDEDQIYFAHKYRDKYVFMLSRFAPEQSLWIGFLRKQTICQNSLPMDMEDFSEKVLKLTEKTFAANLIIPSNEQIGLKCMKQGVYLSYPQNCYSHFDWLCLYMHYCKNEWILYSIFRLKTYCKDKWAQIGIDLKHANTYIYNKIYPKFSQNQKEKLRPLYLKVKSAYHFVSRKLSITSHNGTFEVSYFSNKITDKDISVVVQGTVMPATGACLSSIRKVLPGAEIVLSTWDSTDVDGLDFDKVVFSPDPGLSGIMQLYPHKQVNDVNRQLVSSLAGIRSASRQYCLKLRSDMLLTSDTFLEYYNRYAHYLSQDAPVHRRIMVEGFATSCNTLFDIASWWHLGLKKDLEKMFDSPLYPYESIPFFLQPDHEQEKPMQAAMLCRYTPEQYIAYSYFKRCAKKAYAGYIHFKHGYDNTPENKEAYRRFLAGSFLCLECTESGVALPKVKDAICPIMYTNYSFFNWIDLCKQYETLPRKMTDRKLQNEQIKQLKIYSMAPRYFQVKNKSDTFQDFASLIRQGNFQFHKINKSDITFVVNVNGPLNNEQSSHRCLESIRRFFPKSPIVLSVWRGESIENLSGLYDVLVCLDKPEEEHLTYFMPESRNERLNNVNLRQISIHAGMLKVNTPYAVQICTDIYLINDNFLYFYEKWSEVLRKTDRDYCLFTARILTSQLYTYDVRLSGNSYAMSDIFQFGRTEDMLKIWDGHKESIKSFNYFVDHKDSSWDNPFRLNARYRAEQYALLYLVHKELPDIELPKYYFDHSSERFIFETEKVHASNLLVGDFGQLGLASALREESDKSICLTHSRLLELYLYNVEPGNEKCLAYLKEQYTLPPIPKKPTARVFISVIVSVIATGIRLLYNGVKTVMHIAFPAYRVGTGTRERLIDFESVEHGHFDYLVQQMGLIMEKQKEQEKTLKQLSEAILSKETANNEDPRKARL